MDAHPGGRLQSFAGSAPADLDGPSLTERASTAAVVPAPLRGGTGTVLGAQYRGLGHFTSSLPSLHLAGTLRTDSPSHEAREFLPIAVAAPRTSQAELSRFRAQPRTEHRLLP